ncbi:kinesin family member 13 [Heterostelium album PN500]|uniref:Kinesin family member 13 n=1 Tax=Heterostelium pallidum (strain ATCC 26659 / Pp 5 / PN500) TaxID=670386 RepID=D3BAU8_HETP5|nr:kinesin family member 13 [Heterostelium album PN500]EFA81685.1 kinesin family member 13 [Heterostelium album PN500]|eukprot:XP_020433802.1 kinesin family member 13 [Heterostelium album PN500]
MISGLAIHNQLNKKEEKKVQNVQVFVRVRPLSELEINSKESLPLDCDSEKDITCSYKGSSRTYQFDHIFPPDSRQNDVFQVAVKPIADEVLMGFNGTIFVYGQTGTGKTYTMEGKMDNPEDNGIIPRTIDYIFQTLEKAGNDYNVRCTHLEIYKEDIFDLLTCNNQNENRPLNIYDGKVPELEEVIVNDTQSILSILSKSWKRRQTAETVYNKQSSRSHCIFSITIHIKETTLGGEDLIKIGKLNLVDLAGSENAQKSGTSERMREAAVINQSLLTLGRVITALTSDSNSHIPYRDSKLTRLLQDSLGGKTKTSIIATVSPSGLNLEETVNTLDYALKAKSIRNTPQINQKMSKNSLLKEQSAEIARLKQLLQSAYDKNGVYLSMDLYKSMESTIQSQREKLEVLDMAYHTEKSGSEQLRKQLSTTLTKANKLEKDFSKFKKEQKEHLEHCQNDDRNLRETLNSVMDDLNIYHSKYDSAMTLEKENVKRSEIARKQLEETFSTIFNTNRAILGENVDFCEKMKNSFEKLRGDISADADTTKQMETVANRLEISHQKLNELSESVLNSMKPLTKLQGDHDQLVERMDKVVSDLKDSIVQARELTKKQINENSSIVAKSLAHCIELLNNSKNKSGEAVSQQMKSLDQLSDFIGSQKLGWIDYITKQRQQKESFTAKRTERKAALDKKLSQQLSALISQHTEKLLNEYGGIDKCLDEQLNYFEDNINGMDNELVESIEGIRGGVNKIVEEQCTMMTDSLQSEMKSMNESVSQLANDGLTSMEEINKKVDGVTVKHMAAIKKSKVQLSSKVAAGLKSINQSLIDQQNTLDDLRSIESNTRSLVRSKQPNLQSIQDGIESTEMLIQSQRDTLDQHVKSTSNSNSFISQIPTLLSTKKIERTGKTPIKRELVLPPKREIQQHSLYNEEDSTIEMFRQSTISNVIPTSMEGINDNPYDTDIDSSSLKNSNHSLLSISTIEGNNSKGTKETTTTTTTTNTVTPPVPPPRSRTPVEIIFSPFRKMTKQDSPFTNNNNNNNSNNNNNNAPFIFTGSTKKPTLKASLNSPLKTSITSSGSVGLLSPFTPKKRKVVERPPSSSSLNRAFEETLSDSGSCKPEPQPLKRVKVVTSGNSTASLPLKPLNIQMPKKSAAVAKPTNAKKTSSRVTATNSSSRTGLKSATATSKPSIKNKENSEVLSFSFEQLPSF